MLWCYCCIIAAHTDHRVWLPSIMDCVTAFHGSMCHDHDTLMRNRMHVLTTHSHCGRAFTSPVLHVRDPVVGMKLMVEPWSTSLHCATRDVCESVCVSVCLCDTCVSVCVCVCL